MKIIPLMNIKGIIFIYAIIKQSNISVDEDNSLDEHQKQQIKKDNESILRMCADITKNKLKETEQLIED